jgi:phosphorylcholine metabolism protein LicD
MILYIFGFFTILYTGSRVYKKYIYLQIHKNLYNLLTEFSRLTNEIGIPFFATGGTLLGACRENGIISYDDDLDIGMITSDFAKLSKNLRNFTKYNLYIEFSGKTLAHRVYLKFPYPSRYNVFIDIFEYKKQDGKFILSDEKQRRKWSNDYFFQSELYPLKSYCFGNINILGPDCPYPYLERLYGFWTIPVNTHSHIEQIVTNLSWWEKVLLKPLF